MKTFRQIKGYSRRRGSTLVETMIAMSISAFVMGFIGFLSLFVAKSEHILFPQMNGQMGAAHASQAIADVLRNAVLTTIEIDSDTRIEFEAIGPTSGDTSAIEFSNGEIFYYPDEDDTDDFWRLGRNIESCTFALVESNQMVEVTVRFIYRKYRGFNSDSSEQLNGTFRSRVFPRN